VGGVANGRAPVDQPPERGGLAPLGEAGTPYEADLQALVAKSVTVETGCAL